MLTLWLTPAKGALSGQPGQEAKRQVRRAPCPPEPTNPLGRKSAPDPKHVCRESLTQQAGQSVRGALGKDGQGEVLTGTSLGESGDLSFSSLFVLSIFSKLSKRKKSKT